MDQLDSTYLTAPEVYRRRLPPRRAFKGIDDDFELKDIPQSREYNHLLCETCQHINFESLLKRGFIDRGHNAAVLGVITLILRNEKEQKCLFCSLVVHTIRCVLGKEREIPTSYGSRVVKLTLNREKVDRAVDDVYQIEINLSPVGVLPADTPPMIIHCMESHHISPRTLAGRSLSNSQVDFNLIKSWLRSCETRHPATDFEDPSVLSEDFRLIDVRNRCVVKSRPHWRYLALSYVWGSVVQPQLLKGNVSRLERVHGLDDIYESVPQTIKDAIALTSALEENFLWVDALCIIQDSKDVVNNQIASMHLVYGASILTIVGAYGDDANSGLPGVRANSRLAMQRVESFGQLVLGNKLPSLPDILNQSPWDTRGWTYQEHHLSKRLLFFTERQVYFKCNHGSCCEDVFSGAEDAGRLPSSALICPYSGRPHGLHTESLNWFSYQKAVFEYSPRRLTEQDDALNAFAGAMAQLASIFRSNFLYGLPESELDLALLWYPISHCRRRRRRIDNNVLFPSWSWVGWQSAVRYIDLHYTSSMVRWVDQNPQTAQPAFTSEEYRGQYLPSSQNWKQSQDEMGVPTYQDPNEESNSLFLHPTAPKEKRVARVWSVPGHPLQIQFWAYTADLRITGQHAPNPKSRFIPACEDGNHIICPLMLFDSRDNEVGAVHVPHEIATGLAPGNYEVVVLSTCWTEGSNIRRQRPPTDFLTSRFKWVADTGSRSDGSIYGFDDKVYPAFPWCRYNVLLIERKEDIAIRIGIGVVHITAFHEAGPQEKLIKLE